MNKGMLAEFHAALDRAKERLEVFPAWFPLPILLSFALVLVVGAHTSSVTNPKRGYTGSFITLQAENERTGAIWLGVALKEDSIAILTEERGNIILPRTLDEADLLKPLVEYLNKRVRVRLEKIALSRRATIEDVSVVIAVDDSMRYAHIRPVLQAIAEAKIAHYAFETLPPLKQAADVALRHQE